MQSNIIKMSFYNPVPTKAEGSPKRLLRIHIAYDEMIIWCAIRDIVHKILHPFFYCFIFLCKSEYSSNYDSHHSDSDQICRMQQKRKPSKYSFIMPNTPAANISTTGIPPIPIRIFSNLFTGFSSFKTTFSMV